MTKNAFSMLKQFLMISTAGIAVFFLYYCLLQHREFGLPEVNLLFDARDRYMDFFNIIFAVNNLNTDGSYNSVLPPIFLLFRGIVNKIFPAMTALNRDGARNITIFAAYIVLSIGFFAMAFNGLLKKFHAPVKYRIWLLLIFIFSYPFIFAVDRGNFILLAGALMGLFFLYYLNGNFFLAALFLALAVSLKYYFVIFGIFFIVDRKWRGACVATLLIGLLVFVPLSFFKGGFFVSLNSLYEAMTLYYNLGQNDTIAEALGYNTSIYALFDVPYCAAKRIFGHTTGSLLLFNSSIKMLASTILLAVVALGFVPKIKLHDRFLLLMAGILLFPFSSTDYVITAFFFPAVYWILSEPEDRVMPWLAGLYVICKRYIPLYNHFGCISVTIQSILNPVILLGVIAYIIWVRRGAFLPKKNLSLQP